MKTLFALVLLMLFYSTVNGQCGDPITLSSQAQVDAFPSTYGCTELLGTLTISGNDITNLDSLRSLTYVRHDLIISNNPNLGDVKGLSSLTYVGAGGGPYPGAHITYNPKLTNLDGLNNLTTIAGLLEISNNVTLTNLDGLSSLQSIGAPPPSSENLIITNNPALVSLKGLKSITSLSGSVTISNNSALPNLNGLESLTKIVAIQQSQTASLSITGNASLANIDALSALTEVSGPYGSVTISNNPSLLNLNGLSSLKKISGGPPANLEISNNATLQNVDGLSSLVLDGAQLYLTVTNNPQLARCCGLYKALYNMTTCVCGLHITISGNDAGCTKEEILASGPCSRVGMQPTALSITNVTDHNMKVSFTAATVTPEGYIVVLRDGVIPDNPVDGTVYHVGDAIGSSTIVVGVGNQTSFDVTGLAPLTYYYLDVFSYHSGYDYVTENPLVGSRQTLAARCVGSITLSSQAEVDAFPSVYGCSEIARGNGTGNLDITGSDITNLDSLYSLTKIDDNLTITASDNLTNLNGLSSLKSIGGRLEISNNARLATLDGLSSLDTLGYFFLSYESFLLINNASLTCVNGLKHLTSFPGRVYIQNNASLRNLDGLQGIQFVGRLDITIAELYITGNAVLENIDGLSGVRFIGGGNISTLAIRDNPALTNVNGLSSLESIHGGLTGGIAIVNNVSLTNVDGLSSLRTIENSQRTITVTDNPNLVRGCGLYPILQKYEVLCSTSFQCIRSAITRNGPGVTKEGILAGGPCLSSTVSLQPTALSITNVTDRGMKISFTAATLIPDGYITLLRAVDSPYPDDVPVDGTIYNAGSVIGSSTVVSVGNQTSFDVSNLTSNTKYFLDVFSYNSGYAYITDNPLAGSQQTLASNDTISSLADRSAPFPNPFNEEITIPFTINNKNTSVEIIIYDQMGRPVANVVSDHFDRGYHEVKWNRSDTQGNKVNQGLYLYNIKTSESNKATHGMLVAK